MEEAPSSLRDRVARKELEWRDALEQHVRSLEVALNEKEKLLANATCELADLRADFDFNLKLIESRDAELREYETALDAARERDAARDAETSDLRIRLDELRRDAELERATRDDMRAHYQERLRAKEDEWEAWRVGKETEIRAEKDSNATTRKRLEVQLADLSVDLESQRRDLNGQFDAILTKQRRDFDAELDARKEKWRESEEALGRATRELESLRCASERRGNELGEEKSTRVDLERRLREREWEMNDVVAMKEARIRDLEDEVERQKQIVLRTEEERGERDRCLKEREAQIQGLKASRVEAEAEYRKQIAKLESDMSAQKHNQKQLQWAHRDAMAEKQKLMQRLQSQMNECWQQCERLHGELTRLKTSHELEVATLRDATTKLTAEVARRDADVDRYKRELASGLERERALEQTRVRAEIVWDEKCRDRERAERARQEDLIETVCRARDDALATVRERDAELKERDRLIRVLNEKARGGVGESSDLETQNERLRDVIRQMREDMEGLVAEREAQARGGEDARRLRDENEKLMEENVRLRATIVGDGGGGGAGDFVEKAPLVKAHVRALGDTIGALRSEKVDMMAEVERLKAKVGHLNSLVTRTEEELRQRKLTNEKLEYELSVGQRRKDGELDELKRRNGELELALTQARREADQYYKENLNRNMEVAALGNQISALKVEVASHARGEPSVEHAVTVAQLEDEIFRLKDRLEAQNTKGGGSGGDSASELRLKLKSATKKIIDLSRERQQLIDISNSLRANLNRRGESRQKPDVDSRAEIPAAQPRSVIDKPRGGGADQFSSQLNALEDLQYELTKRELQFAQLPSRTSPRIHPEEEIVSVSSSSFSSDGDDDERSPPEISVAAPARPDPLPPVQFSSSQDEGERSSLREVWRLLETGEQQVNAFTPRSAKGDIRRVDGKSRDLTVGGQSMRIEQRGTTAVATARRSRRTLSGANQRQKSIRNYNRKDV